jgi:hypothetical protein
VEVADVLRKARALLTDPSNWCQGYNCRDANGRPLPYGSSLACSYCLVSAVCLQLPDALQGKADLYLNELRRTIFLRHPNSEGKSFETLHPEDVPRLSQWNDAPSRTHEDVLLLLDVTIRRLESQ